MSGVFVIICGSDWKCCMSIDMVTMSRHTTQDTREPNPHWSGFYRPGELWRGLDLGTGFAYP